MCFNLSKCLANCPVHRRPWLPVSAVGFHRRVTASADSLAKTWQPLAEDHKHEQRVLLIDRIHQELATGLDNIRRACRVSNDKPPVPKRAPPPPARGAAAGLPGTGTGTGGGRAHEEEAGELARQQQLIKSADELELNVKQAKDVSGLNQASAAQAIQAMSEAVPLLVQDCTALRGAMDQGERRAFLAELLALLDGAAGLAAAARDQPEKLTEAAVVFGDRSCKLLFVVSTDVDPGQQKELVAPAIQHPQCQQTLIKATSELSSRLNDFSKKVESTPGDNRDRLKQDSAKIQGMLGDLLKDLEEGKLVKRRPVEKVVVEHTPLRLMACSVLEDAKKRAEQTSTTLEAKHKLVKYANELAQAVSQLDLAYYRCTKAPQDIDTRNQLENAVQELQVCVLQNRPALQDRPQNNIVDLTDYVREVSEEAGKLHDITGDSPAELKLVKEHCAKIKEYADRVMYPQHNGVAVDDEFGDDIKEVHQFAEDADKRVKAINSILQELKDGKQKGDLQENATLLRETVNILRFATDSALATSQSVSLDATLEELLDLEGKLDEICGSGEETPYDETEAARAEGVRASAAAGADQGPPRGHLAARRAPGGRGAAARRAAGAALSLFVWRRCAGAAAGADQGPPRGHLAARRAPGGRGAAARRAAGCCTVTVCMAEVRRCAGAAAGADQGPPRGHLAARRAPGGRGAAARRAAGAALSLFVWRRCAGAAAGADQGPPRGHLAARRAPGGRGAAARRAAGAALSLFVWRRCAGAPVRRLALTRGRLVATWQRGAHPEAAALLRAVLQVLHCHCLYGGGAPVRRCGGWR
ncbi:hypothetical protein ACJJTC_000093 [Scirpophaga incertulas]